jgi:hypothetical protein
MKLDDADRHYRFEGCGIVKRLGESRYSREAYVRI